MKKKLYYVVELELENSDGVLYETTGNKTVYVYDIANDVPTLFCILEIYISDDSEEEIQQYLNDNGYGDETFEFTKL